LTDPRYVLIDSKSKPEFGPRNGKRFGPADIGVVTTLGKSPVRIVDFVTLGTGLACNGACIANFQGFAAACPWQPLDRISFGLLRLRPDADVEASKAKLQRLLGAPRATDSPSATPADVEVLTRAEVNAREEFRWVVQTPLGRIFNFGVWVALFVGVAIVYQVLSTDIANMMSEYATLKAMGYSNRYLTAVVLQQAVLLAMVGYVPSIVVSWFLYWIIAAKSGMPMQMTWQIAASVIVLAVAMCVLSGVAALRKLFQADPADLF
jgi:putative ABC transport system permease protein